MPKYLTKQRRVLLSYLGGHADELLSVRRIADELSDAQISLSAVYRNLSELESEGKVRKYVKDGMREVFYQYMDADGCKGRLHLACLKCGRTFHMDAKDAELLAEHIRRTERFAIDQADTAIYGTCEGCQNT